MALNAVRFGFRASIIRWTPSKAAVLFGSKVSTRQAFAGRGYIGGQAPASSDPDEVDGRFRILNQPARGRINVFERGSTVCIASLISNADGTWRLGRLDPSLVLTVVGYDDTGQQNAAIQDWVRPASEG